MPEGNVTRAPRRIDTAVQTIYNNKWQYPPVPKNATYSFKNLSTTGNSIPFWYSPRQAGTLQEKEAWHEELRRQNANHLPAYMMRDRAFIERLNAKGLTHEKLDLSAGELRQPVPFSLDNNFFQKKQGDFLALKDRRQSVTRHHWGVLNHNDLSRPQHSAATRSSTVLPLLRGAPAGSGHDHPSQPVPVAERRVEIPGQVGGRTEGGLKVGPGFEHAQGRWVLQFVPAESHEGSIRRGTGARAATRGSRSATSMGMLDGVKQTRSVRSQMATARSKSVLGTPAGEDIDPAKGRTGTALKALHEKQKAQAQAERRLLKTLRTKMQLRFKDTAHLPMNLWKAFTRFDADGSGRIERDEFVHVCHFVGIDESTIGKDGMQMLFQCADKNDSGDVDFQEFLSAIVGNLVTI